MKKYLVFLIFASFLNLEAQISIFSDFENGNVELLKTDQSLNSILIRPSYKTKENKTRCWFYFGMTGYDRTDSVTVGIKYSSIYIAPIFPVYSYDKKNWYRIKTKTSQTHVKTFKYNFSEDTVYIATGYPYTYSKILDYIDTIANNKYVDTTTLTYSEGKRKIPMFTIKDKESEATDLVWIIGRQHAFETTMNYTLEGFVNYLISENKKSRETLKNTIFYIVPMVDVDNVFIGASGRMQEPIDFNRDWSLNPYWKAIKNIQELLKQTSLKYNYRIFLDFHSTFPGSYDPIFGLFNEYPVQTEEWNNIKKLLQIYEKNAGYRLTEIKGGMDKFYASAFSSGIRDSLIKTSEFSSTVECDWTINHNGKNLTQKELRKVGALLAESVCDYLNTTKEKK